MSQIGFLPHFIAQRAKILADVGIDSAEAEMEWILCHVLDIDRLGLYLRGETLIDDEALQKIEAIIARRVERYPLQFILEESWFYGRKFFVNPSVMAPTPETESLCEAAIGFIRSNAIAEPRLLDVGTGSGVIAVTMAAEVPSATVVALDISEAALEVARRNAQDLGVADRIEFRCSDFFSAVSAEERFHLILSNPPYICDDEYPTLQKEVLADPKIAMVGGEDGLDAVRVIVKDGPACLERDGRIMFEIGYGQLGGVADLTEKDGRFTSFTFLKDLGGVDRVIILGCGE